MVDPHKILDTNPRRWRWTGGIEPGEQPPERPSPEWGAPWWRPGYHRNRFDPTQQEESNG